MPYTMYRQHRADLADVAQLIPGLASPVFAGSVDPVLHLSQACLDILPVAEAAALAPQQQLVEQLHIHKAEQLLEQLAHLQHEGVLGIVLVGSKSSHMRLTSMQKY